MFEGIDRPSNGVDHQRPATNGYGASSRNGSFSARAVVPTTHATYSTTQVWCFFITTRGWCRKMDKWAQLLRVFSITMRNNCRNSQPPHPEEEPIRPPTTHIWNREWVLVLPLLRKHNITTKLWLKLKRISMHFFYVCCERMTRF